MAGEAAAGHPCGSADVLRCNTIATEDSDEDSICAICFEHRPFVNLPCECKINYCATCWDRALATSVTVRGRAQCPSCRSGFRIDFNQDAACLVFSKEEKNMMTIADWRSRLYGKARPVQIRLLKDFGDGIKAGSGSVASEGAIVAPAQKSRIISLGELPQPLPQNSSSSEPLCVCGAHLENIDSRTRIIRMLEDTEPGWRSRVGEAERLIDSLASSALITCDLCEDIATRTGGVWTCKNGPHTVLHPAAYDVCESCFALYAGCPDAAQSNCGAAQSTQVCGHGRANRCCQICTPFFAGWQRRRASRNALANLGTEPASVDSNGRSVFNPSSHSPRVETASSSPAAQNSAGGSGIARSSRQTRWRSMLLSRLLGFAS